MRRSRRTSLVLIVTVTAILAAACGGSGSSGGTGESGAPVRGGTLHMLGVGDVDYMDPNISYYTIGNLALRLWSRQLFTYPAEPGKTDTIVPDLASEVPTVSNGGISKDGKTYTITIRTGSMWNTSPARQVTAADEVRGVERTCNPVEGFGGLGDYESLIVGFVKFCSGFAKAAPTPVAIAAYMSSHHVAGLTVDPTNPQTIVFKLVHPVTYFVNLLALPALSPAPKEFLGYKPGSAELAQHTISDGPYEVQSYNPAHTIEFVRNPAWKSSTDLVRHAYVDKVDITETGNQSSIQQQLQANTSSADMEFDAVPPSGDVPGLISSHNPNLSISSAGGTEYLVLNLKSPNNRGALAKLQVRQAIAEAVDRSRIVQTYGGQALAKPLTQMEAPGTPGQADIDPYPTNSAAAKKLLTSAGYPNGLTLKFLYRADVDTDGKAFQVLQSELAPIGIHLKSVAVPSADWITKYLEVPSVAARGVWDLSLIPWYPDWYGQNADTYLGTLLEGPPPEGEDFSYFDNSTFNSLINQATSAVSATAASRSYQMADTLATKQAAEIPLITFNQASFHSNLVHNPVYIADLSNYDPTNVWLSH
jgi:peptide/nickel transport system substrate-binding protein